MGNLVGLTQAACSGSDGGILEVLICKAEFVTDVTFDVNNQITGFTMSATDKWAPYEPDTDLDQVYFNQTGSRAGNKHTSTAETLLAFSGLNNTKRTEGQELIDSCALIAVIFTTAGTAMVQGVKKNSVTGDFQLTKKKCKATVDFLTQTGADDDTMFIKLNSEDRTLAHFTTMTKAALLAL